MSNKMNISSIITGHYKTLRNFNTKKISKWDIFVFIILPIFIASLLTFFKILINDDMINILLTSFSIFAGLLLNLLLLIYSIIDRPQWHDTKGQVKKSLVNEIFSNISYSILLSITMVVILIVSKFEISKYLSGLVLGILKIVDNFIIYFIMVQFILFMFVILKRIHKLLSDEFKNGKG